jgi:DeoR/GlpR family transcriptional regulator of sugar metabolism
MRPDLTELAAAKLVERHGRGAIGILEQRAELSAQLGHRIAAATWRTMAEAAAQLLRTRRAAAAPVALPPPPAPSAPRRF